MASMKLSWGQVHPLLWPSSDTATQLYPLVRKGHAKGHRIIYPWRSRMSWWARSRDAYFFHRLIIFIFRSHLLLRLSVPSGLYSTALASLLKYPQTQRCSSWLMLQTSSPTILAFLKPLTFPSPAESKPTCLDALFLWPPWNHFITLLFIRFIFSLLWTYTKMNFAAFLQGLKSSPAKQGTLKNKSLTHQYWDDDLTSRPSLKAHQNPTWSHV